MSHHILEVRDLRVEFDTYGGVVKAVRGVSFDVKAGKTLAIVGESGCGKSVTVQSIMGLIPRPPGRITSGSVKLDGNEILGSAERGQSFSGPRDRNDFPGSDDVIESDDDGGPANFRDRAHS
jgi:ABC-type dipeptide/oligopeptide/nickel transport system ATPase component